VIVYPLDYARTRLANQVTLKNRKDQVVFNGLVDCLKKTYKTDGIIGLYRGFIVSCFCMVIYRGLYFGIYDTLRPFLPKKYEQNMLITFSLGYLATITSGACSYPLDTVRRRMMMTSGEIVKFKGSW
jgi:solute carrier family 25 (adenine nucleotide translocator) protein 4/5/6/31